MHFPLTPHHVQLISACYPPSAALLTAGPEYKPNSQELSRLTYYASNHPGKITKLSSELQKRIAADCRKARSGNTRSRASLLITLNIFKALVTECRRDITLLSSALMASLDCTLSSLPGDLEVAAKTATVFTAWATYTTGQLLGVDATLTRDYFANLRKFHALSVTEVKKGDYEDRNRTRLIGLGGLTGAVTSEALYNSASQFKPQAAILVSAFLTNILQANVETLENQVENIKNFPVPLNPYLSDFRTRPLLERRAASIHVHVEGDKGPSMADVANSALRAFSCLLSSANALQIGSVMQALFDGLGVQKSWSQVDHCCWIIQKTVEWAQYQYRFAVPIRLVERLSEAQDDPFPSDLHLTLSAMIKAVFTAPTPLVNLSTSDIMANLTALILRRIVINANDALIPELVDCIGSLGTHLYYADQIHDLACELIGRLLSIEMNGLPGRGRSGNKRNDEKSMGLRSLVSALEKLLQTSSKSQNAQSDPTTGNAITLSATISDSNRTITPSPADGAPPTSVRPNRTHRTKIPPDVWQETLILLCDESFAVRADYYRALTTFLRLELRPDIPSSDDQPDKDGFKRTHVLESGPYRRAINISSVAAKSSRTYRFLHALHAFVFVALTCPCLSVPSFPPSPSRTLDGDHSEAVHVNVVPSTPLQDEHSSGNEDSQDTSQNSQSSRRKSVNITPQTRKIALIRRLMGQTTRQTPESLTTATANDFSYILMVLTIAHERVSSRALFTGIPMLVALEQWCSDERRTTSDTIIRCRRRAIRELILRSWLVVARVWDCREIAATIDETLSKCRLVLDSEVSGAPFPALEEEIPLGTLDVDNPENLRVDPYLLISHLSRNRHIQFSTGMDEESLRENLSGPWSPEGAMRDSLHRTENGDIPRPESMNPVLKISPALMHISNMSLQSLTRSARAVGVSDLREALEGRRSLSNLALSQGRAPSVSSFGAATYSAGSGEESNISRIFRPERPKRRLLDGESPREVRDVLDKLGIGAKNGANLLKTSLSSRQKLNKGSVLVPPYKN